MASITSFPPDINLGPLTTTFTAPADCQHVTLNSFYDSSASNGSTTPVMYTASSCFPSGKLLGSAYTASTLASFNYHDEHIYFSPGICPSGWTQQPVSSTTVAGRAETTALCCEPGFTATTSQLAVNDHVWRCYTNVTDALSTAAATKLISARQNFGAEPACAIPCLTSAISAAGCALSDTVCQCGTGQAAIQTAITPCLISACNAVDIGIAASVGLSICSSHSAVLTTPTTTTAISTTTTKSTSTGLLDNASMLASSIPQASGTTTQNSVASVVTPVVITPFLISADPVFIKYRDGDFSSSTSFTGPSVTTSPRPIAGLSMGAKIGLGVAIPLALILIGVAGFIFFRKRKQQSITSNRAQVTHDDMPPDYPSGFKAELQDPGTNLSSGDVLGPVQVKSELQAPTHNKTSVKTTELMYVPELESARRVQEHPPTGSELDTHEVKQPSNGSGHPHPHPSELDVSPVVESGVSSLGVRPKQVDTGPLTIPEEFAIVPSIGKGEEEDDEELEYQERRLRERREILAEKEKIAREEEELRNLRKERKGGGGGSTSSGRLS